MTYVRLWYHYVSYCFGARLKDRRQGRYGWRGSYNRDHIISLVNFIYLDL